MNIKTFLQSLFKSKDSITLDLVYKLLLEVKETQAKQQKLIEGMSAQLPTNNLTVVSQKPVSECGNILNALTKRRQSSDSDAQSEAEAEEMAKRMNRKLDALMKPRLGSKNTA